MWVVVRVIAAAQAAIAPQAQPFGVQLLAAQEEVAHVDGAGGEAGHLAAVALVELAQQMVHEGGDVFTPFAQRQHVEAEVPVFAEAPFARVDVQARDQLGGGVQRFEGRGAA